MRVNWNLNDVEITDGLRAHIQDRMDKLSARLEAWEDDAIQLTVTMEKVGTKDQFRCALNLSLPQRTLHAEEIREDRKTAFNASFDDLMRQEKRMMARLRRQDRYEDVASAKRSAQEGASAAGEEEGEEEESAE